jgi:hypothetical protein
VIEVIYLDCASGADAGALFDKLASMKPRDSLGQKGRTVVELVLKVRSLYLASRYVKHRLGLPDDESRESFACTVSPLASGDAIEANEVFNIALKGAGATDAEVKKHAAGFTFSDELRLNDAKRSYFQATFAPKPAPARTSHADDVLRLGFGELDRWLGIPRLELAGELTARGCYEPVDPGARDRLAEMTKPTKAWPADDDEVRALAKTIAGDRADPLEKLKAIHGWVFANVKFGGPTGCRCGVKNVLSKRLGPCWDKSDVFVTLCHAQSLPARQLAGWVRGLSGHVWSEVYLEGRGWLPVDTTCPWLGTSQDYFPWFASEDGELHVLYLSMPTFKDAK